MIFDLPFDVVFCPDYENENIISGWEAMLTHGYQHYRSEWNGLLFQILTCGENDWYIKVTNNGKTPRTGFVGVRFPWSKTERDYTLIPGIYYDGNYQKDVDVVPMITEDSPVFEASLSAASFPAVLVKQGAVGYHYGISARSDAGWNGVSLDAERNELTIFAPAKEKQIYRHCGYEGQRLPHTWNIREIVTLRIQRNAFACETVSDVFHYHWENIVGSIPVYNNPKMPEDTGAALVRDWIYDRHCVFSEKGEPLLLNAFLDVDAQWPFDGAAEWRTMIGWCSGTMTALPLLKAGGKYRDFAVSYIDFLTTHGNSPSGVKYCIYDGNEWMKEGHGEYTFRYTHCRFYGDYLYYLGKAIRFEKENGCRHPLWDADFAHGIRILCDVWRREGDFGHYWDLEGSQVNLIRRGNGAGAFCLLALAEAVRHFADDDTIKNCFTEACQTYYYRCVVTGRCNAGPADIWEADDSESIAALSDALVQNHTLFGGEKNLVMARQAAEMFATWVINYIPYLPAGSMLEQFNACGGVLANVRNRHVGPGICTNSARFLYDLGVATGDDKWKDLYFRIKAAAINCITAFDGEFFGGDFGEIFRKGMLSEQINVTDALNYPGETWRVSACWPATAVLLGWYDSIQ